MLNNISLWKIFDHNKHSHSIKVKIRGKEHYFCARCTGIFIGTIFILGIGAYYAIKNLQFPFKGETAFFLAAFLATPSILDWATSQLELRETNNQIRLISGFLLGLALFVYFQISYSLPLIFLSLLLFISILLFLVSYTYHSKNKIKSSQHEKPRYFNIKRIISDESGVTDETKMCCFVTFIIIVMVILLINLLI